MVDVRIAFIRDGWRSVERMPFRVSGCRALRCALPLKQRLLLPQLLIKLWIRWVLLLRLLLLLLARLRIPAGQKR
jgi:hypothetical protein